MIKERLAAIEDLSEILRLNAARGEDGRYRQAAVKGEAGDGTWRDVRANERALELIEAHNGIICEIIRKRSLVDGLITEQPLRVQLMARMRYRDKMAWTGIAEELGVSETTAREDNRALLQAAGWLV